MIGRFIGFCFMWVVAIAYMLIRYALPIFILYYLFTFILQNPNIKTWAVETRGFFVILSALSVYGVYLENDKN